MQTIFVLFDSLNRPVLGAYGDSSVATPNFYQFASHTQKIIPPLRRFPALNFRSVRPSYWQAQLPAPNLGTTGTLR